MFSCFKRTFCCSKKDKKPSVYILKLKDGKYYVGESSDVNKRVWMHQNDNGSAWTRRYSVEEQIDPISKINNFDELAQTLEMMRRYGIDNVRGSMFTKPFPLNPSEKIMAAQLYCELNGLCRRCGGNDHFIGACPSQTVVADWVSNFGGQLSIDELLVPKMKRECLECKKDIATLPQNFKYCRPCFMKVNGYK